MHDDNQQQALISALYNPSIFPSPNNDWQLIETHISWVILCGPYAYKIKKALNLGFLNCTTLASRKFYCEEELRLNSRLAPQYYLQVVSITGTPSEPQFEGQGDAFEYAVKMKRFPPNVLLSKMLEGSCLQAQHIDQLITQVAEFHQSIPASTVTMSLGDPARVHAPALENFDQIRERINDSFNVERIERLRAWTDKEYQRRYTVFEQRKQQGFVRECHGDMHLGNMVMIDDSPLIFDGIEFNPDLYWIDVMSEVAFLFMDLENHGRRDYAYRFLNGYLELTGDYSGLQVFRYYLTYRAIVRAKVATIRIEQQRESHSQSDSLNEFERYMQLAVTYSYSQYPILLITHGLSGSGKSTLSAPLAEPLGAIRIRSDRERQRLLGRGKQEGEASDIEGGTYSPTATAETYAVLESLAAKTLSAGYSVIIDATFLTRQQRDPFKQLANRFGIPMRILFFHAEPEVLKQRIGERQRGGLDISEADSAVLVHQIEGYTGLDVDEQCDTIMIDTELPCSGPEIVELIKESLNRSGPSE